MRRLRIVFDLDDTLYLERDYVRSGLEVVGQWAAAALGIKNFSDRAWGIFESGQRESTFQAVLEDLGREPDPQLLKTMVQIYRNHRPAIRLLPDAAECLSSLRSCSVFGLITDGTPERQRVKCSVLGICNWFDHMIYTGDWGPGYHKPHPRAYECMQAVLGTEDRFVYVGDNPLKDFSTPRLLGWDTIRIRRPRGLHFAVDACDALSARTEIADLAELPKAIL